MIWADVPAAARLAPLPVVHAVSVHDQPPGAGYPSFATLSVIGG